MTNESIAQVYDPYKIDQVYLQAMSLNPQVNTIKNIPPSQLEAIIPAGACPQQWYKTLCNFEYNLSKPKPRPRKRRRSAGTSPRNGDFARVAFLSPAVTS